MISKIWMSGLVLVLISLTGCAKLNKDMRHVQSSWVGLDRTITLYGADGGIIGKWNTRSYVDVVGPVCAFTDSANKEVKISGTFIIRQN